MEALAKPRTWIELSKNNLLHNIQEVRSLLSERSALFAVVKSNAYGHGMHEVAKTIKDYVDGFCVANTQEALSLKSICEKKRIIVLSYFTTLEIKHLKELLKRGIELPVYNFEILHTLKNSGYSFPIHVKFDTGTSRIGFQPDQIEDVITELKKSKLDIRGMYSHFSDVEDETSNYSNEQLSTFQNLVKRFKKDFPIVQSHIACSAAIARYPESHMDIVRLGIHLYGLSGLHQKTPFLEHLNPVLSWKCTVLQVKKVHKGTHIGYNGTYAAKENTTIVTLPVGYWDGYDRTLSNKAVVIFKDARLPVRGSVCMNLLMCELFNKQISITPGNTITLLGQNNSADDLAHIAQTINYEIVTRIHPGIPRIII